MNGLDLDIGNSQNPLPERSEMIFGHVVLDSDAILCPADGLEHPKQHNPVNSDRFFDLLDHYD